jgi:hypothetical protein
MLSSDNIELSHVATLRACRNECGKQPDMCLLDDLAATRTLQCTYELINEDIDRNEVGFLLNKNTVLYLVMRTLVHIHSGWPKLQRCVPFPSPVARKWCGMPVARRNTAAQHEVRHEVQHDHSTTTNLKQHMSMRHVDHSSQRILGMSAEIRRTQWQRHGADSFGSAQKSY